jgi:hypothetical protein
MLPLLSSAPENRGEGFRVAGSLFSASGVTLLQLAGRLVSLTFTLALRRHYSQQPAAAEIPQAARLRGCRTCSSNPSTATTISI